MTNLPPSCADCLEIWEPQSPGTLRACNGIALPFLQHTLGEVETAVKLHRVFNLSGSSVSQSGAMW